VTACKCKCGSTPIQGCGSRGDSWVAVLVCRAPERHSCFEKTIAIGFGISMEVAVSQAEGLWESLNSKKSTGERSN